MITLIIVVTIASAGTSFFCSIMEAALYAISPGKIEELRADGNLNGERLRDLRAKVDEPIAAILALNTIANSMGAAFAGALVANAFPENAGAATLIYSLLFVILILYFSEIVPKTLGVTYADRIAPALSLPLVIMVRVLHPFVLTGQVLTRVIRKHRGSSPEDNAPSENEIRAMAELGARAGTLLPDEARWAVNAMKLNDVKARDLMTPRTVVYMLPAQLPLSHVVQKAQHWTHSRLPVTENNDPDRILGVVHRREVFDELVNREEEELEHRTLADLMHEPVFVPETISCDELLKMFIRSRQHLIIVSNEFGGMEGVISLEDLLEYILGEEIVDPHDPHEDMQELARRRAVEKRRRQNPGATPAPKSPAP